MFESGADICFGGCGSLNAVEGRVDPIRTGIPAEVHHNGERCCPSIDCWHPSIPKCVIAWRICDELAFRRRKEGSDTAEKVPAAVTLSLELARVDLSGKRLFSSYSRVPPSSLLFLLSPVSKS